MKKFVLVFIFFLTVLSPLVFLATAQAQTSTVNVTLYAGEKSSTQYGFGNSSTSITSPGPTLTFISGQTVTVTLQNAGTMPHDFAIVNAKSSTATVLWNAQVASASNPVSKGSNSSVTFTVGSAGNYYYVCQVDGHVALGMWGNVVVQAAIPEFPTPLLFVFATIAVTAFAAYISRVNIKRPISI
jgi:plastocyanin